MVDATGTEAVIQGVTAPMVAVPGPGQALMARSAGFGGTMPGMTAKIALRGGNQEAFRRWIANRNDVITANGLDQLMDNSQMPTLEAVGERFPNLSSEQSFLRWVESFFDILKALSGISLYRAIV